MTTTKFIPVLSGGLDSTTMMMKGIEELNAGHGLQPNEVHAIGFNYGQRHEVELGYAWRFCNALGIRYDIVDLRSLTDLLASSHSALIDRNTVMPEGHYAAPNMAQTVVPNRNMIMYSIAAGILVAEKATYLGVGVHSGDHFVYPDCRPFFIDILQRTLHHGNEGFIDPSFMIYGPFTYKDKTFIAQEARRLERLFGIDIVTNTWSCYAGGDVHCGRCGTCVERAEALAQAYPDGDPTVYADSDYWRTAIADGAERVEGGDC